MAYRFGQPWTPVYRDSPILANPLPPSQGSISTPKRTLTQRTQDTVSDKLRPWMGKRMAAKVATAVADYSPVSVLTTAYDAGHDLGDGNYLSAAVNGVASALNVLPDGGGALAGKALHSIIAPLWHGSPHKFEKFALDKIGTGEGAQAYGHGLYFAENPEVAKSYITSAQRPDLGLANITLQQFGGDRTKAIRSLEEWAATRPNLKVEHSPKLQALQALQSGESGGHLYQVQLDANPEDFLDWDAPANRQPAPVRKALSGLLNDPVLAQPNAYVDQGIADFTKFGNGAPPADPRKGELIYRGLGGKLAATGALQEAGIPGLRYYDQGSRHASGLGTRNYVVFDPSIIDILNRQ